MFLGYCVSHFCLFKLSSFFNLVLFSSGIHNGREKKLTNNYKEIKLFLKDAIYLFCCQGHLKQFLENYRFCRKSENDAYSWGCGRRDGHVICVNITHCIRKFICDSLLTYLYTYQDRIKIENSRGKEGSKTSKGLGKTSTKFDFWYNFTYLFQKTEGEGKMRPVPKGYTA